MTEKLRAALGLGPRQGDEGDEDARAHAHSYGRRGRRGPGAAAVAVFLTVPGFAPPALEPRPAAEQIAWRDSVAVGSPSAGRLVRGVRLPDEGEHFFTWDPVRRAAPNRPWRRVGTDDLVRVVLAVVAELAAAHPEAPRVGIGDLSRPRGGPFGPKHVSHQNGLDVDVYLPRRDGRERPPRRPEQIDRGLAQDLVDRFVRAGAEVVFVGPRTGLRGPSGVVQVLWNHDNHLHVRLPPSTME